MTDITIARLYIVGIVSLLLGLIRLLFWLFDPVHVALLIADFCYLASCSLFISLIIKRKK